MAAWMRARCVMHSLYAVAVTAQVGVAQHAGPSTPPKGSAGSPAALASTGGHPLTAADLETFLDGFVPQQIGRDDIAGVVVVVVKDGNILLAKGYGYADVAAKRPVIADSTLFRPGSVSKLFTWTAVMQQVELGKLDLDHDVNEYLDFKVPPAFGRPITLRDLMTHRPGFEETVRDLIGASPDQLRPLDEYLRTHMPARIYPPGKVPAYSNYGATLAGYIVQRVSGQPFDEYIDQHIYAPLQMTHSTFRQPLPATLEPLMSKGYEFASKKPQPYELVEPAPAGSMAATGTDMAHFMIAHLTDGTYSGGRILQPATLAAMHARQAGWPDAMPGFALGFYEESRHGHRIIGHAGDTQYFHSDLHLILDANVGIFLSYNSAGRDDVSPRTTLFEAFMDRYFPSPTPPPPTLATAGADARAVAGVYVGTRRFETNFLTPLTMLSEETLVVDPTDSTLIAVDEKGVNGLPVHYREVGPLRFSAVDGQAEIAFAKDSTGRRIIYKSFPFEMDQQVDRVVYRKSFNEVLLGISLGVVALTLLGWPIGALIRRHYARPLVLDRGARRLRHAAHVVCLAITAFVVGFVVLASKIGDVGGLGPAGSAELHTLQLVGVVCVIGALVVAYRGAKRTQWVWGRIWNCLLALSCLWLAWFIVNWHMLNFTLNY